MACEQRGIGGYMLFGPIVGYDCYGILYVLPGTTYLVPGMCYSIMVCVTMRPRNN